MIEIPLSQGMVALIDNEDLELIDGSSWSVSRMGNLYYAQRRYIKGQPSLMHRLITGAPKGMDVDHINHNGLDNRRSNLRICTRSENLANLRNLKKTKASMSRFKGVDWHAERNRWRVRIANKHIGRFKDEIEAAKAYDRAAVAMFGEFANTNFPIDSLMIG